MYHVQHVHAVHAEPSMPKKDNLATARLDYRDLERVEAIMYREDRTRSYVIRKAVKLGLDVLEKRQAPGAPPSSPAPRGRR